jgi:hypothetical protein
MPIVKRFSFERWDLAEPIRVAPSSLYTLTPRGLGTPYVESLSSYVMRLAEAHVVSVWRLILHVRSQVCSDRLSRPSMRYAYPANGLGKGAEILRQSFETATGRSDLRPLTLSALQGSVSKVDIFRTTEAWCPACLEQWRQKEFPYIAPCFGQFALLWCARFTPFSWSTAVRIAIRSSLPSGQGHGRAIAQSVRNGSGLSTCLYPRIPAAISPIISGVPRVLGKS